LEVVTLSQQDTPTAPAERYDVIVIGAGMSGMCQLHRLRQLGLSARVSRLVAARVVPRRNTTDFCSSSGGPM